MVGPRAERLQFADKVSLFKTVRNGRPNGRLYRPGGSTLTRPFGVDDAPAKDDRREVPLAGCTQTHEEAHRARRHVGLINRWHHRRD